MGTHACDVRARRWRVAASEPREVGWLVGWLAVVLVHAGKSNTC